MERIIVIGTSCSGKTTLARRIADVLGLSHIELDTIFWGPNWGERPTDEFREAVRKHTESDRWIVDGNHGKALDILLSRATDAIWLNYSFPVVFWRALSRTCRRVIFREEIFGGNRETFVHSFLSRGSILLWVMRTYRRRRRTYRDLFSTGAGAGIRLTELRRPGDADELVDGIRGADRFVERALEHEDHSGADSHMLSRSARVDATRFRAGVGRTPR